ncbi:phage antirepressor N-terminal domain-containing protein [Klebsiella pneumoniae]|uniref:phage antirepressor N-terminal domain-containing protein n=1 Tax=Klebsiella pneumoniae TaxID=573 RepID=UPI0015D8B967|nr:phage antirepressor N-terminal domain-containing protein [Klebsiella pneumoniae]
MTSIAILEAVNTSYVPFNGQQIITAMAAGIAYVAMKPIVENLGMSWGTQQQKLMKSLEKFNCIHMNMVAADGKLRKLLCLPLKKLNGWLFSINPEKVRADIRDKLIQYQEECFTVLHDYWTKGNAENPRKTQQSTAKQLTPLRQTAERLIATGMGRIYPDIWKFVHQHFEIEHINQLKPSQISEAVEYLDALEGEFLGKQQVLTSQRSTQFTDNELCTLCWLWNASEYMREKIELVYPALRTLKSEFAGNFYSMSFEYKRTLDEAKKLLDRETKDKVPHPYDMADENWRRVLPRLRQNTLD